MKILGIIPARYASTRFPGKPLVDIAGKSMIRRVYEQAQQSNSLTQIVVATDDERIVVHVNGFGGRAILTSPEHQSGTDRCAEIALKLHEFDYIVNIQGDEPFIHPGQIDLLCSCFQDKNAVLATLVKQIDTDDDLINPNIPKVILNSNSEAIYFSRTVIPHFRGKPITEWLSHHIYYKHIGIYGYQSNTLHAITKLPISSLERAEALEQLRWIENGFRIKAAITDKETHAVDTPEDLEKILKHL
jgi:3-deoxy-manno-octulosonate cytidylyltransferase (CMP-KDO synthetase)